MLRMFLSLLALSLWAEEILSTPRILTFQEMRSLRGSTGGMWTCVPHWAEYCTPDCCYYGGRYWLCEAHKYYVCHENSVSPLCWEDWQYVTQDKCTRIYCEQAPFLPCQLCYPWLKYTDKAGACRLYGE